MKRNETPRPLLPQYARLPLLCAAVAGLLAYYGTKLITRGFVHYDFTLPIDGWIPFVPAFSIVYVLAYAQWGLGLYRIAQEDRETCRRVMAGEITSKLICLALFLIIPTTMVRAEVPSGGGFNALVRFLYGIDAADNLFPSIHCLDSWVCFRGAQQMKRVGKGHVWCSLLFTLLVFASTVLIKQHVAVDILAGVLVAEMGQYISRKWRLDRIFEKMDAAFLSK